MREIVFDTETTGLDPYQGDRLVEIGCVELVNGFPTGNSFHRYLNPERDIDEGALRLESFFVGQVVGSFQQIRPAGEITRQIVADCEQRIRDLGALS